MTDRLDYDDALNEHIILAMDRLGRHEAFRTDFVDMLTRVENDLLTQGVPKKNLKICRLWKAFCKVAPAMYVRGSDEWAEFSGSHYEKLKSRNDWMLLVRYYCETHDEELYLERVTAEVERGEMSEVEYLHHADMAKFARQIKEREIMVIAGHRIELE
jgi:hypothetical protein